MNDSKPKIIKRDEKERIDQEVRDAENLYSVTLNVFERIARKRGEKTPRFIVELLRFKGRETV